MFLKLKNIFIFALSHSPLTCTGTNSKKVLPRSAASTIDFVHTDDANYVLREKNKADTSTETIGTFVF